MSKRTYQLFRSLITMYQSFNWRSRMNLPLFVVVFTCLFTTAITSIDSQLFRNDRERIECAITKISESEIRFSLELYKATANVRRGFFSVTTADIFIGLSMLYYGAKGRSQEQLSNVLNYSPDCAIAQLGMQDLVYRINQLDAYFSVMRNAIFHTRKLHFDDGFIKKIDMLRSSKWRVKYGNDITRADVIAAWITDLEIAADFCETFDGGPLVLVSAASLLPDLYLSKLNASTCDAIFHYNNGTSGMRQFVKSISELIYGELHYRDDFNDSVTAQYIKLSWGYEDYDKFKTIIILPNERDGITELEENINEATIREIISNTDMTLMSVSLPSDLVITAAIDLTEPLKHMHLTEMFKETRDFEEMFDTSPIKMGPVFSVVEMAQSMSFATELSVSPTDQVEKSFNADHPFIILSVLEDENPLILAMARFGWVPGVTKADGPISNADCCENA